MNKLLPIDMLHGEIPGVFKVSEEELKSIKWDAQEVVRKSQELGFYLDYSHKSIESVESILEILHRDILISKPSEQMVLKMGSIYGAYIGETFIRNLGQGEWVMVPGEKENNLAVFVEDEYVFFHLKALKRLKDGEADNIVPVYMSAFNSHSSYKIHLNIFNFSEMSQQVTKYKK